MLGSMALAMQAYAKASATHAAKTPILSRQQLGLGVAGEDFQTPFQMCVHGQGAAYLLHAEITLLQQPGTTKHVLACVGSWAAPSVAAPAYALRDAALTGLHAMVGAFGSSLSGLAAGAQLQLPYGSLSDVDALLAKCEAQA